MVKIAKGTMSKDVDVVTIFDGGQADSMKNESDEKFTVTISNADYATIDGNGTAIGTILSNDTPVFEIEDVRQDEGSTDTNNFMEFMVTLSSGATEEESVHYKIFDGTAMHGTHFNLTTPTGGTRLAFPTGTPSQPIRVPIIGNRDYDEMDRSFTITLLNNSTGTEILSGGGSATGTILNDDSLPPVLSIAATNAEVDEVENAKASFTITAENPVPSGFKFRYSVTQKGDFLVTTPAVPAVPQLSGTLTFNDGATANTFTALFEDFRIEDDDDPESSGSVTVTLLEKDGSSGDYTLSTDKSATVKVFDDDIPELSIAGVGGPVVEGSGNKATFTITSHFNAGMISVRYRPVKNGSNFLVGGTEGTDQEKVLDFNNTRTATLELEIHDDEVVEEDGSVIVQLLDDVFVPGVPAIPAVSGRPEVPAIPEQPIQYSAIDDETSFAAVAVQDNDMLVSNPTVSLGLEYYQTGANPTTYYVVADTAPAKDLGVIVEYNYAYVDNTDPVNPVTYYRSPQWSKTVVEIANGETFKAFTEITGSIIPNTPFPFPPTGTLTVRLVDGDNYDLGTVKSTADLLADTDPQTNPIISISPTNPLMSISVVEDDRVVESSVLRFEVTAFPAPAAPAPSAPVSIPVIVYVTQTGDFISETLSSGRLERTVLIPKSGLNKGRASFTVGLDDDTDPESANGVITATLQTGTGYVIGDYSKAAKATVFDNDSLPVISIANSDPVSEGAGMVSFTLTAGGISNDIDLAVDYAVRNEVGDFIATQTPVFDPLQFREVGGAYTATVNVMLDDDELDEAHGSVSVILEEDSTYPFSYAVDTSALKGIATVMDDDDMPELTMAVTPGLEGDVGANGSVRFLPTLSTESGRNVVVTYSTTPSGDFPVDDSDYNPESDERIVIPAGQLTPIDGDKNTRPIIIRTTGDDVPEPDETFTLTFRANFAGTAGGTKTIGTIQNDDGRALAVSSTSVDENVESRKVTLKISLSPAPGTGETITVSYRTQDGTATGSSDGTNADYTSKASTDLDFLAGQSSKDIEIYITNDMMDEADEEMFTVVASTTYSGVTAYAGGVGTVTIEDDDLPTLPTLTIEDVTTPVAENAGVVNFEVRAEAAYHLTGVRYQASEVSGGNFLDAATGQEGIKEVDLTIDQEGGTGPFFDTFEVAIHDDEVGEATGQIMVTLLAQESSPTYQLNSDGSEKCIGKDLG